ncbi:hypothetical protein ACFL00_03890 [Pseudomonadota bacterium]
MKRFALIAALCLVAGLAHATFELADPAAEILKEQQEPGYGQSDKPVWETEFCVIEMDDDQCFCIQKETKDRILLTEEECQAIVSPPEKTEEP